MLAWYTQETWIKECYNSAWQRSCSHQRFTTPTHAQSQALVSTPASPRATTVSLAPAHARRMFPSTPRARRRHREAGVSVCAAAFGHSANQHHSHFNSSLNYTNTIAPA